jgi:hypothetical protein
MAPASDGSSIGCSWSVWALHVEASFAHYERILTGACPRETCASYNNDVCNMLSSAVMSFIPRHTLILASHAAICAKTRSLIRGREAGSLSRCGITPRVIGTRHFHCCHMVAKAIRFACFGRQACQLLRKPVNQLSLAGLLLILHPSAGAADIMDAPPEQVEEWEPALRVLLDAGLCSRYGHALLRPLHFSCTSGRTATLAGITHLRFDRSKQLKVSPAGSWQCWQQPPTSRPSPSMQTR